MRLESLTDDSWALISGNGLYARSVLGVQIYSTLLTASGRDNSYLCGKCSVGCF
jgi:hypothetical protein